jgi:hypothetical protein
MAGSADGRPSKIATERLVIMAVIEATGIPDTKLCKQITELVRDTEPELLSSTIRVGFIISER